MCKHVAAVLYGIGARLDEKPELLFVLRGVDHRELVSEEAAKTVVGKSRKTGRRTLDESRLSEVFGIDVAPVPAAKAVKVTKQAKAMRAAADAKPTGQKRLERARRNDGSSPRQTVAQPTVASR